jgi:hypothetical protein
MCSKFDSALLSFEIGARGKHMRTQSKFFATAILALAVVPACQFNCSVGGPTPAKVADSIKNEKIFESLAMTSVTCPENADMKPGSKFECTAEGGGKSYRFSIEMKDGGQWDMVRAQ